MSILKWAITFKLSFYWIIGKYVSRQICEKFMCKIVHTVCVCVDSKQNCHENYETLLQIRLTLLLYQAKLFFILINLINHYWLLIIA